MDSPEYSRLCRKSWDAAPMALETWSWPVSRPNRPKASVISGSSSHTGDGTRLRATASPAQIKVARPEHMKNSRTAYISGPPLTMNSTRCPTEPSSHRSGHPIGFPGSCSVAQPAVGTVTGSWIGAGSGGALWV